TAPLRLQQSTETRYRDPALGIPAVSPQRGCRVGDPWSADSPSSRWNLPDCFSGGGGGSDAKAKDLPYERAVKSAATPSSTAQSFATSVQPFCSKPLQTPLGL